MSDSKPNFFLTILSTAPPPVRLVRKSLLELFNTSSFALISSVPSAFLEPLLTCRLIYQEAFPRAFSKANFFLVVKRVSLNTPFWSPQILTLPESKLRCIRRITVHWDNALLDTLYLRKLFRELECGPLNLSELTFTVRNKHCLEPFRFKFALFFPGNRDFARYITEELPLLDNVKKIVFTSPSIERKRYFQYLFDPKKPGVEASQTGGGAVLRMVKKKLGDWEYNVVRCGTDVTTWRLELTHPNGKRKAHVVAGKEDENAGKNG
jgi:hypothetical protein